MQTQKRFILVGLIIIGLIAVGYFYLQPQANDKFSLPNHTSSIVPSTQGKQYNLEEKKDQVRNTIAQGVNLIDNALKEFETLPQ